MKGETRYLLPNGFAHAPMAYTWNLGGFAFTATFSSPNIKRLRFLLVLAVLLTVLSRVYCSNYKLHYNKNNQTGILEPKPTSKFSITFAERPFKNRFF